MALHTNAILYRTAHRLWPCHNPWLCCNQSTGVLHLKFGATCSAALLALAVSFLSCLFLCLSSQSFRVQLDEESGCMGLFVYLKVAHSVTLQVAQGIALWRDQTSAPGVSHPVGKDELIVGLTVPIVEPNLVNAALSHNITWCKLGLLYPGGASRCMACMR